MIVSFERKVVVLFTPRTGTKTLHKALDGIPLDICDEYHTGYDEMLSRGYSNFNEFQLYAFYRDPFERCISIMNYLRRGRQHAKFFHAFYGDEFPVSCASRKTYWEWENDQMRQMCDSVPMIEVFRKLKWYMERGAFGKTHKRWLSGPVIPLNFKDYDAEVGRVLSHLGVDPSTVAIPHINHSYTLPEYDSLTPAEEGEIREFLQEDYLFLESKGIRFA